MDTPQLLRAGHHQLPHEPLRSQYASQYASSFLATYRASVTILKSIKNQFQRQPSFCARFWLTWSMPSQLR